MFRPEMRMERIIPNQTINQKPNQGGFMIPLQNDGQYRFNRHDFESGQT